MTKQMVQHIVQKLKEDQLNNGSWDYPFDTGIKTDAYMIILLRTLKFDDEVLIQKLAKRVISMQEENGAWKLFSDEESGNLSTTVEAYYSLLYSGYYSKDDIQLRLAKKFILANGGIEKAHMFTKVMMALTGQLPWSARFPIPVEFILLPRSFPINFYDISVYGRANLAPIMIVASKKYRKKTKRSPDLSDLFLSRDKDHSNWPGHVDYRLLSSIEQGIKSLIGFPRYLQSLAIERAKQYMISHLEPDGTLYSYFSGTFLMIFALLSLGYSKKDPFILKAVSGLKAMSCTINGFTHMQYTTANIWNTSLISYALQESGVSPQDPVILKANEYLLERQHYKYGDWVIHNPGSLPGGWGFSDINTINPDVDDTTAVLRSLSYGIGAGLPYGQSWDRGLKWTLSMQNDDGGWPAFEKNVDKTFLKLLPVEGGRFLLEDPSTADLTGRTLEFLGNYTNLSKGHVAVKRGINWLFNDQKRDGSWYGRWGICYIYGTWAALTGLRAVNVDQNHQSIKKAVHWLHSIQNEDGGWGESCYSDIKNTYVPLGNSNRTQTAWALDALIAASEKPTKPITDGIHYLTSSFEEDDETKNYPVGQGMAGGFYLHYHSYHLIFPLIALAHYDKKFK